MLEREAFGNATVVAKLQAFHWVWVDKDHTPDLPKRLNVSAYPGMLVLGPKDENVHRWEGFLSNDKFLPQVDEALQRNELFNSGKDWDQPTPRAASICQTGKVETFKAPSEENPAGIAFCNGKLWIAQGSKLYRLDEDYEVELETTLPASVRDLGSDGKQLYGITYGWTAGTPIHELDPETGKVLRSIETEANKQNKSMGGFGIACHDGALWALESFGKLHRVDPETGNVTKVLDTKHRYVGGLDFDGKHFVLGSRTGLHFADPATGKVEKNIALAYPVRALACRNGKLYVLEQPVFGFGRKHERIRVWPTKTLVHVITPEPAPKDKQ